MSGGENLAHSLGERMEIITIPKQVNRLGPTWSMKSQSDLTGIIKTRMGIGAESFLMEERNPNNG